MLCNFFLECEEYFQVDLVEESWQSHGLTRMLPAPMIECEAQAVRKTVDAPQLQCIDDAGSPGAVSWTNARLLKWQAVGRCWTRTRAMLEMWSPDTY